METKYRERSNGARAEPHPSGAEPLQALQPPCFSAVGCNGSLGGAIPFYSKLNACPNLIRSFRRIPSMVRAPLIDPSSTTRPTRACVCNRDAMAGFAAAHG
jgi:hypothetical protein